MTVDADQAYWSYMKLNGTKKGDGSYWANAYTWDQARRVKMDKVEECKLLYSH